MGPGDMASTALHCLVCLHSTVGGKAALGVHVNCLSLTCLTGSECDRVISQKHLKVGCWSALSAVSML